MAFAMSQVGTVNEHFIDLKLPPPLFNTLPSASQDNIRLWNLTELGSKSSLRPFQIIAGHHGGLISNIRKLLF